MLFPYARIFSNSRVLDAQQGKAKKAIFPFFPDYTKICRVIYFYKQTLLS